MGKNLPLIRRLELALECTSSNSEQDIVYGKLNDLINNCLPKTNNQTEFYKKISHDCLYGQDNGKKFSKEDIETGKEIAEYLQDSVIIPETSSKTYRRKMKDACNTEYFALAKRYKENE